MNANNNTKRIPVAVILSLGGHTFEALSLVDRLSHIIEPSYLIMDDNFLAKKKIRIPGRIWKVKKSFSLVRTLKPFAIPKEIYCFMSSLFSSLIALLRFGSKAIISVGSGASLAPLIAAKILFKKIIFIESACRIFSRSACGNFAYRYLADLFFVQWEEQLLAYPKAIYAGRPF
jgi:UDP-N-acetylglucosamine:LPS N-acetylglucosamine transferase